MKDTIKANVGYKIRQNKYDNSVKYVYDGEKYLFEAVQRSWDDYTDECVNGSNEMALQQEVFTTVKGNQFIYWIDLETDEDFVTKVPQQQHSTNIAKGETI